MLPRYHTPLRTRADQKRLAADVQHWRQRQLHALSADGELAALEVARALRQAQAGELEALQRRFRQDLLAADERKVSHLHWL